VIINDLPGLSFSTTIYEVEDRGNVYVSLSAYAVGGAELSLHLTTLNTVLSVISTKHIRVRLAWVQFSN